MSKRQTDTRKKRKLTTAEKREIRHIMERAWGDGKPHSAQDTLPFRQMYPDGLCKLDDTTWSRCIEFADVNYQLAQTDDQTAIFEALCDMYNAHDSSIGMEICLPCHHMNRADFVKRIEIASQQDDFDDLRELYTQMLRRQLEKGNNGLVKPKLLILTVTANDIQNARAKFSRIVLDALNHFKTMGALAKALDGREWLELLHGILHPDGERFSFQWDWLPPSGLHVKEDDNPLALKSDFILSFCELAAGGRNGLEPVEKTLIDRAVRSVYRPYIADPRPENMPILEDLYDEIKRQPEPEAQRVAAALELYVHGSLNVFNHRTNVDINNRLVCFDIKELGKQLKNLGMLVIQDQVWNRVSQNRDIGKSTWYFVDEFHLLLRGEVGAWSVEIWKRFRKWGGIPTGITQNVKDLLASPEIENIFENSDFIYLLNQASGDRRILCERLNISSKQAGHISNAPPGEGLIVFGNVILPFKDDFPKDNELYRIMTTRPSEVAHLNQDQKGGTP